MRGHAALALPDALVGVCEALGERLIRCARPARDARLWLPHDGEVGASNKRALLGLADRHALLGCGPQPLVG
jgi:hypothetical protein